MNLGISFLYLGNINKIRNKRAIRTEISWKDNTWLPEFKPIFVKKICIAQQKENIKTLNKGVSLFLIMWI